MVVKIACLGKNATVRLAVDELRAYLAKMDPSSETVVLSAPSYNPALSDILWVGLDDAFSKYLPEVEDANLDDAICIAVKNGAGIVTGTNGRSVLIAVYRLLRENGVRYIRPGKDGELIPSRDAALLQAEVREAAAYRHRGVCIEGGVSYEHVLNMIKWLPKLGMNEYFFQFFVPVTFFERWYSAINPLREKSELSREEISLLRDTLVDEVKLRGLLYHAVGHGWTCEPLGIPGNGWDKGDYAVPDGARELLAELNGERELFDGLPLNTNLCYGNEKAQETIVNAIAEYAEKHPQVDYLHFWLADAANNHCECPLCRDTDPADYYIRMLNRVDELLTQRSIPTKIVFLLYVDLLWEPQREKLQNPDRFVLMFAPITRTYTTPFLPEKEYTGRLEPYHRNKNIMPKSVEENLARLGEWRKQFSGDGFDFDYHLMWDHFKDFGYYGSAKILHEDMKNLKNIGLNGMLSCQLQRCFFPTALPMHCMAEALWDSGSEFASCAGEYFSAAFGEDGEKVRRYLSGLSQLGDAPYLRKEKPLVDAGEVQTYIDSKDHIASFLPVIEENLEKDLPSVQHESWRVLLGHAELTVLLAEVMRLRASGEEAGMKAAADKLFNAAKYTELAFPDDFDQFEFLMAIQAQTLGDG